jgi:hypothetical protein
MNKNLFLGVLLFMPFVLAYDFQDTILVEGNSLPTSSYLNLTLTLAQNYTANFTLISANQYVNLSFLTSINFTQATEIINITYNISGTTPEGTYTNVIQIENNYNNLTKFYALILNVTARNSTTISINSSEFFSILDGGYNYTYSINLLPLERELPFNLTGTIGMVVNVSCSEWLSCPTSFMFIETSYLFNLKYNLSSNLTIGTYEQNFTLSVNNQTRVGKIFFNIVAPELVFQEYVYKEECFSSEEALFKCIEEEKIFYRQQLSDIYALALSKKHNYTETIEVEKPVMVGSVDIELKKMYDSCIVEKDNTNTNLNTCQSERNNLFNEKVELNNKISIMNQSFQQQQYDFNQTLISQEYADKERVKRNIIIIIILILFLAGLFIYNHFYKKFNHENILGQEVN